MSCKSHGLLIHAGFSSWLEIIIMSTKFYKHVQLEVENLWQRFQSYERLILSLRLSPLALPTSLFHFTLLYRPLVGTSPRWATGGLGLRSNPAAERLLPPHTHTGIYMHSRTFLVPPPPLCFRSCINNARMKSTTIFQNHGWEVISDDCWGSTMLPAGRHAGTAVAGPMWGRDSKETRTTLFSILRWKGAGTGATPQPHTQVTRSPRWAERCQERELSGANPTKAAVLGGHAWEFLTLASYFPAELCPNSTVFGVLSSRQVTLQQTVLGPDTQHRTPPPTNPLVRVLHPRYTLCTHDSEIMATSITAQAELFKITR